MKSSALNFSFTDEVLIKLHKAARIIKDGGVIVCPTEGVYGLSCLARNDNAIKRILSIKHRALNKGLIVVCAEAKEVGLISLSDNEKSNCYTENIVEGSGNSAGPCSSWVDVSLIDENIIQSLLNLWPCHLTAIVPVTNVVSNILTGNRNSLALRVTPYPLLAKLCELVGEPIVSTSANISGCEPLKTISELTETFEKNVDYILDEPCQGLDKPSKIIDAITGKVIRD